MFPAACYQLVKATGRNTLHPVPSLDEKKNVAPLQLVVKTTKRRFIFFEKAYYRPTEFQLSDVLINQTQLEYQFKDEVFLNDYEKITQLSLKGKFGAELCDEIIDVELETNDSVNLSIKFGKLNKSESEVDKLIPLLQGRRINMDHPFIKEVRKDKRKVLCLITGVVSLAAGGTISRVSDYEASVVGKSSALRNVNANVEAEIKGDRELGLTAGTPVAYNIHELNVGTSRGEVTLVLTKGQHGSFASSVGYDEVDATSVTSDIPSHSELARKELEMDLLQPKTAFHSFLSLPSPLRDEFRTLMFDLFTVSRDLSPLSALLDEVVEGRYSQHCVSDLEKTLISPKQTWIRLLELSGFTTDSSDMLLPPTKVTDFVTGLEELFDAVTCLDDDELELIRQCSAAVAPDLLLVLRDGLRSMPVPREEVPTLEEDEAGKKLLLQLQYSVESDTCTPPTPLPCTIDEIYWTLFALWGQE